MSITINSNAQSLGNIRNTGKALKKLESSFEKLSSGRRINKASDDPAGLAIAEQLLAEADAGAVASRNISDAVSVANIAEGSLQSASQITTRLSELATQASNGTLSSEQRSALNNEFQALTQELDRISQSTEFNGNQLLSGSTDIDIQAGTDGSANSRISLSLPGVSSSSLGITGDLTTQENAQAALDQAKGAVDTLTQARGRIGATVSRLDTAFNNLQVQRENSLRSASAIVDVDVAQETANLTRNRILAQAGTAVQAQANLIPGLAVKLLGQTG